MPKVGAAGGGMGTGGSDSFVDGAKDFNKKAGKTGIDASGDMMKDLQGISAMNMKMQTEQGLMQMMTKLNEAMAKMFKAIGTAVSQLA